MEINVQVVYLGWRVRRAIERVREWHQERSKVGTGIRFNHPEVVDRLHAELGADGLNLVARETAQLDTSKDRFYVELPEPYEPLGVAGFIDYPQAARFMPAGILHKYAALWHDAAAEVYAPLSSMPEKFVPTCDDLLKAAAERHERALKATDECKVVLNSKLRSGLTTKPDDFYRRLHWHTDMSNFHTQLADALLGDR